MEKGMGFYTKVWVLIEFNRGVFDISRNRFLMVVQEGC
jgi:hypothetical protein